MLVTRDASSEPAEPSFRQYRLTNTVGPDHETIKIRVDAAACELLGIRDALENALDAWNTIDGIQFSFTRTSCITCGQTIKIRRIRPSDPGHRSDVYALADTPDGDGNPGAEIRIYRWPQNPAMRTHVLMHEIGHTLGLRHTDWRDRASCPNPQAESVLPYGAEHIPGSPEVDADSVMNACAPALTDFSVHDKAAIRTLYPG